MEQSTPLSLQAVLQVVQGVFETTLAERTFRCKAEVLQAKIHKGRVYLDIVEYSSSGAVVAKARAIIWEQALLEHYLVASGIGDIDSLRGKVVMFQGACRFHQQWGLSITILALSHEFARGQLVQQQAVLREKLKQAGLYGLNRQQSRKKGPVKLAVISSATSQGFNDLVTILQESAYQIDIELFPSSIHGETAKKEVAAALDLIKKKQKKEGYTAVVIVRGGGGGEGLLRQNDEEIANRVCAFPSPVILATGHTSDTSLLDELVWHAAKTPTDAAYLILEQLTNQATELTVLYEAVMSHVRDVVRASQQQLNHQQQAIKQSIHHIVWHLQERVTKDRQIISGYGLEQVLNKGYAVLQTVDGRYLSHQGVTDLKSGDQLLIKTAEQTVAAKII